MKETNILDVYHIDINARRKYVTFIVRYENQDEAYFNYNFQKVLDLIKARYLKDSSSTSEVYCFIANEANRYINVRKKDKERKKVSNLQIKSIRRAFRRIKNTDRGNYIMRIPFNIIPIMLAICSLLDVNDALCEVVNDMNKIPLGQYLYEEHIHLFGEEIETRLETAPTTEYYNMLSKLNNQLTAMYSLMNQLLNTINWEYDYIAMR